MVFFVYGEQHNSLEIAWHPDRWTTAGVTNKPCSLLDMPFASGSNTFRWSNQSLTMETFKLEARCCKANIGEWYSTKKTDESCQFQAFTTVPKSDHARLSITTMMCAATQPEGKVDLLYSIIDVTVMRRISLVWNRQWNNSENFEIKPAFSSQLMWTTLYWQASASVHISATQVLHIRIWHFDRMGVRDHWQSSRATVILISETVSLIFGLIVGGLVLKPNIVVLV